MAGRNRGQGAPTQCPFRIGDAIRVVRGDLYGNIEYGAACRVERTFWFQGSTEFQPGWWVAIPTGYNYQVENIEMAHAVPRNTNQVEDCIVSLVESFKGKKK
jgi:hypothetical protein